MNSDQAFNKSMKISNDVVLDLNNTENKNSNKVDINTLMSKVREKQKKEKKENLTFICLVSAVVVATVVIASL